MPNNGTIDKCLSLPLVQVHIGLLAHQVGVPASDTLYFGQSIHDLLLAVDIGIEETQDKLEVRLLPSDESCAMISTIPKQHDAMIAALSVLSPLAYYLHIMGDFLHGCHSLSSSSRYMMEVKEALWDYFTSALACGIGLVGFRAIFNTLSKVFNTNDPDYPILYSRALSHVCTELPVGRRYSGKVQAIHSTLSSYLSLLDPTHAQL